jgi:hypothetical protein
MSDACVLHIIGTNQICFQHCHGNMTHAATLGEYEEWPAISPQLTSQYIPKDKMGH